MKFGYRSSLHVFFSQNLGLKGFIYIILQFGCRKFSIGSKKFWYSCIKVSIYKVRSGKFFNVI